MNEKEAMERMRKLAPEFCDMIATLQRIGVIETTESAVTAKEPLIIVCGLAPHGIDGSVQRRCQCGRLVWLSPSSQKLIAKRIAPYELRCSDCLIEVVASCMVAQ